MMNQTSGLDVESLKAIQWKHAEATYKPQVYSYSGGTSHDYFRRIPFLKTKELLDSVGINLNGKRVLVGSCGTGIDVFYLRQFYDAQYFVTDLSENAVKSAL